ncbi:flagellar hook-length control protein FliK [Sphingopyxis sp. FD7]|jgi:flagellar hook-length control protein FliK|uniref:flagellar hook-length control protein FliK n=1 Tax=Sphingopyxis sp. FD7 TaxID=1914525 RepID=UPI000DC6345B|nr:flagellar hook-length control protein FliK [Sphingopyxis sp. FD7]BBB13752.1 flagellar hook-length control protein [Sphingopyxis sp. FD7]
MMNAPALPAAPGAMPAGFAAFLAHIGQVAPNGKAVGFDRLLAAAPVPLLPVTTDAPAAPVAPPATTIKTDVVPAAETGPDAAELPVAPTSDTATVKLETSPAKPAPDAGDAAALAATLLVALSGARPGPAHGANKPTDTDPAPDVEHPGGAPAAPAIENWATIVSAVLPDTARAGEPRAAKPETAKPHAAASGINTPGAAPDKAATDMRGLPPGTLAAASPPTRDAVMSALPLAADPPVARVAEAAPAMTVLFTQAAALTAAAPLDAAAPAPIAERVLDMDSDGAWIDQLARDIAATKSDSGDISFRLMPRHLGRLDVAMQMGDEGMSLKMDTQHEATATIVTAAQGRLVDELRQQGVRVAGAEVTHTPGETGRQSQGQSQGRAATPDTAHLIETATERAEPRDEARAADRRGRFA